MIFKCSFSIKSLMLRMMVLGKHLLTFAHVGQSAWGWIVCLPYPLFSAIMRRIEPVFPLTILLSFHIPHPRQIKNFLLFSVKRPKPRSRRFQRRASQWRARGRATKHIKGVESTSYMRLLWTPQIHFQPQGKAMVQCPWFCILPMVYGLSSTIRRGVSSFAPTMRISKHPFRYTYSVGFGIAYPRLEGNAKAYRSGMSDEFRFPRFFYVDFWL